jgi:hypothetical protein
MSNTTAAKAMHRRSIEHQTWLHEDGSLEIQSRLIDTKAYDTHVGFDQELPAGEPVHDMTIRILLGTDGLIQDIEVRMDRAPFDTCPEITHRFKALRGASMGKGWNAFLTKGFSGIGGCRHLIDLLRGMGTVAFQSTPHSGWNQEALESFSDSCYAFRQGGPVMVRLATGIAKKTKP